jgi:hypothetical protein
MFSTFQKENRVDTSLSYVESDLDVFNKEKEQEQMVKDIYLCYGGAGSLFAGKPTSFCNLSSLRSDKFIFGFDRVSAKTVNSPSIIRDDEPYDFNSINKSYENTDTDPVIDYNEKIDIKQFYIGSLTIVGLYILFRILQRS